MSHRITCSLLLLFFLANTGCDKKSKEPTNNFDRQAMLSNYASRLIFPAYNDLYSQVDALHSVASGFNIVLSTEVLVLLQNAWNNAYTRWQYVNAYNFGPAGEDGLRKGLIEEVATFPVSESKIEAIVANNTWNLNDFERDARGFLAIEYLIFGKNQSAEEIVAAFANSPTRRAYLIDLIQNIYHRVGEVRNAWHSSYSQQFAQNAGTDVGSSTSLFYNEFVRSYESIKNFKLGLPLGKRPAQIQVEPQLVEAYYSGQSLAMLKVHLSAVEDIWYGRDKTGQDGIGLREYLESVEGGNDLIASTEAQLAALKATLAAVPESPAMAEQITGDKTALEALYVEFSKMTRFFKSDLSSLLGIAITFSSGDGD